MLERVFIKDYKNIEDPHVRNAYGVLSSVVGIVLNICLSVAKMVVGILAGAVAIVADGINNLTDAGSSIVTMFSFRVANKPADHKHPFGHARVEYVASMIISFIVLFLGIELAMSGIEKIVGGAKTVVSTTMMIVLAVSIVVKIGMFIYYRHMSRKIHAEPLKATSIDSLSDAIASSAVLVSMIVTYYSGLELDGIMTIVVALLIVLGGVKLFKETISPLIGEAPTDEFVEHISAKIHSYDGVMGIHDLVAHNYGYNKYYASLHVEVDAKKDIMESHALIDTIERDLKAEGYDVVIHLDPVIADDDKIYALKMMIEDVLSDIDSRITYHDFRVVWGKDKKKLVFDIALPDDIKESDAEIVTRMEQLVAERDPSCYLVVDVDRNYLDI